MSHISASSTTMLELLAKRRSVAPHLMIGPGPDPDQIQTLLTLGSRVPDHGKLAPWRFILFEGDARDRAGHALADIYKRLHPDAGDDVLDIERRRLARAPLVIAVVSCARPHVKIPEWEQILSAGAVCMTLTMAANAMGFVSAWLTEWFAYERAALDEFGLQPHEKIAGFVHIGRMTDAPTDRPRPLLSDIVSRY